jgi:hypothetical protein
MSDVVNKTTMQYLKSVNTPDYPEGEWWINPKLPACDQKYWRNASGKLSEMTATQKQAVDNAETEEQKQVQAEQIIQEKIREVAIQKGVDDGLLNADGSLK